MFKSGIYKIQSIIKPERIYIGSAVSLTQRKANHLDKLRNNLHQAKMQNHYNKYGESDLVFSVLMECRKEDLIIFEQSFIDLLNPYFNIRKIAKNNLGLTWSWSDKSRIKFGGENHPMFGKHQSKEAKDKSSKTQKNRTFEEIYGIDGAKDMKDKLKKGQKGHTGTYKRTKPVWNKGIQMTEEQTKNMRHPKNKKSYVAQ